MISLLRGSHGFCCGGSFDAIEFFVWLFISRSRLNLLHMKDSLDKKEQISE